MSLGPADLGRRLLDEVEEVNLSEVITSLQNLHGGATTSFGIPALDELVGIFQPTNITHKKAAAVQIDSTGDDAGAASLLYHAIAAAVLPCSPGQGRRPGRGGLTLLIDLDGRFDVERLERVMICYLGGSEAIDDETQQLQPAEDVVSHAMKHVHVFRPQSMASLAVTAQNLEAFLFSFKTHASGSLPLALVGINNVGAFYWQDRAEDEYARFDTSLGGGGPPPEQSGLDWTILTTSLRQLQRVFGMPILATNSGLVTLPKVRPDAPPSFKPHLPGSWQGLVTLRLVTERETVKKFAGDMSLETALTEAAMRLNVVRQGKWGAWVDLWGSEEWNDVVRQKLRSRGGRGFLFWVKEDGVYLAQATSNC